MKHHKLFYGSSYDRFTLIIRRAIIRLCKQFNAITVVKMLKNTPLKLRNTKTNSVISFVNTSGTKPWMDLGKAKKYLISSVQIEMFQGVKMVDGRVVREPIKMDTSLSGIKSIHLATITGIPENTDLLLRSTSGDILGPMRSSTTKTGTNKIIN